MLLVEFPRSGWPANVYTGELRYVVEDFEAVDKVRHKLNLSNQTWELQRWRIYQLIIFVQIVMGLEKERDEREILTGE